MDRLQAIDTFVRVAEVGSFVEAARQLGISKSVVTTRVQHLEEHIGAPLFHRTTRHVSLSEIGEAYLSECADLIARSNELIDMMSQSRASLAGKLRIHALPGFVLERMPKLISRFLLRYPELSIEMVVDDAVTDPVKAGVDCALQIFPPASNDLIERRLFPVRRVFCAAPNYLDANAPLETPADLAAHSLGLYSRYPTRKTWMFRRDEEEIVLDLDPSLECNSIHFLRRFAKDGGGVVCIPTITAHDAVINGDLKIVLGEYALSHFWFSAVYPQTQRNMFKLRLFLDALMREFSGTPDWDEDLKNHGLALNSWAED